MQTTVLLEPLCTACDKKSLFVARIYSQAIDSPTVFNVFPGYKGTCILKVTETHLHVGALNICEGDFLIENYLDLGLCVLEAFPEVQTASWERHKATILYQGIDKTSMLLKLARRRKGKKPTTL